MTLELAPAAIIRAPAWPIETLEPFGDPDLANECCSAHPIDSAYETAVNRERMALWDRTVGDPSFMRALLLASPSLFERARAYKAPLGARSKSVRHLETSLYRYLALAAARPTPNHLWAGVTLAPFCDKERIVPAVPRADFSPDLAPFAFALNALGKRNVYRQCSIWRICLTLRRQQDGAWRFMVRLPGGATEIRQIETKHALDDYFDRLRNAGTGTLRDLSVRADVPLEFVERLADAGVLVGGLSFPVRFTSPWEALKLVEDALVGNDRDVWKQARTSLAEFSDRLAVGFDRMAANDMVEITGRARALIAQFLAAIDVKIDVPPMPFRCDFRLPFNVTLGRRTQRDLQNTLELYQSEWIDHASPSSSARRERRRALAKT